VGSQWKAESMHVPPVYRECLRPFSETRPACLWRVFKERGEKHDEAAGAVADRIFAEATLAGVALPVRPVPVPFAPSWHGPMRSGPPSLLDRVIDTVSPPPPSPADDVY
jgi:hypothetical protein